ncbi:HP1e [Drosophila busckii]|uniref:HP1e n=1 Tax=Drosophila busckii TaxID=30019 RepID=A0A0M4EFV8_DROBS|nr:HP1e [Drosophila busckii]
MSPLDDDFTDTDTDSLTSLDMQVAAAEELYTSDDSLADVNLDREYIVERILDRRKCHNRLEYFVKWLDFPETDNTWERADNLSCKDLVHEFELQYAENNAKRKLELEANENYERLAKRFKCDEALLKNNVFECGYDPLAILSATDCAGKITFLIKFKCLDQAELVPAEEAYEYIPQLVIKYYEQRCRELDAFVIPNKK